MKTEAAITRRDFVMTSAVALAATAAVPLCVLGQKVPASPETIGLHVGKVSLTKTSAAFR